MKEKENIPEEVGEVSENVLGSQDQSRRAFVKKSLAAGIIAAQPTILAGLIRADGGGGGGTTTPWGTTMPQTTVPWGTTYQTTYGTTSPWGTTYANTTWMTTYPNTTYQTTFVSTALPGVKRIQPIDFLDMPMVGNQVEPATKLLDANQNVIAELSVLIQSPQKEDVCVPSDFVKFHAEAILRPPFPVQQPFNPGGTATVDRYYLAYRGGADIETQEAAFDKVPINTAANMNDKGFQDLQIAGKIYRLYVETKRILLGGNTVEVHARGVLKEVTMVGNPPNQQRNEAAVISTEWAKRKTIWSPCTYHIV